MKTIGAGKFKAKCLALLNEVAHEHETIIVTKRGKPIARITAVTEDEPDLFAKLSGSVLKEKDIVSPLKVKWKAGI